jgi:hypothetical protein
MSLLASMLEALRPLTPNSAMDWAARRWFNRRAQALGLGQMTKLHIDSANRRATLDLELKGEAETLHVTIGRYELTAGDGKTWLEIKEFQTSREWINAVAAPYLRGRKFEVPELLKAVL